MKFSITIDTLKLMQNLCSSKDWKKGFIIHLKLPPLCISSYFTETVLQKHINVCFAMDSEAQ